MSGVLKGTNSSHLVSKSTIICYYIIGIPCILILSYFLDMKIKGIWLGFGTANFILFGYFIKKFLDTDWSKQASQINEKLIQSNQ